MTASTRYVLWAGVGVLGAGLLAGGVAYVGSGPLALVAQSGPDELRYVPVDARLVAYADVREVMRSSFRERVRHLDSNGDDETAVEQERFREATGIDIERDIDYIVVSLVPGETLDVPPAGLALMVGTFDVPRLEALARDHGGTVHAYGDHSIISGVPTGASETDSVSMSFVESGVVAIGSDEMVRRAIDLSRGAAPSNVTTNDRLMRLMSEVRRGHNTWAVAEFDGLDATSFLPEPVREHVPPLTAFSIGGRVNGGLSTTVSVETRDETAAQDLRQVVQGFVALARMQTGSYPSLQPVLESIRLASEGTTVTLSLDLPATVLDLVLPSADSTEL